MDTETISALAHWLLALAAAGTPSCLVNLTLKHCGEGCLFDALPPVFEAGGLPRLKSLVVEARHDVVGAEFPEAWVALGSTIKLEQLAFNVPYPDPRIWVRVFKAFADPHFCPFLRRVQIPRFRCFAGFDDCLEERRVKGEALRGLVYTGCSWWD